MVTRVLVLNGPNLGRLGKRDPEVYGSGTYDELVTLCEGAGHELGLEVEVRQSDAEAELLSWLHEAADDRVPVVLNPGGLAHTSVVLADACAERTAPLIEVHISNVHAREAVRHHSHVAAHATGTIVGLGHDGYVLALSWIASQVEL